MNANDIYEAKLGSKLDAFETSPTPKEVYERMFDGAFPDDDPNHFGFKFKDEPKDNQKHIRSVILKSGNEITPQPIYWLWKHWLAQGKFHILAGSPGVGKTTLALMAMATVSIGGVWPDGSRCEQGNVLIWSGEDDATDTLLPRLIASGVDRGRVFFVDGTRISDNIVRPFDISTDLAELEAAAIAIGGVSLIVIDPVVTIVTGDSHKNTETRRGLQPLVDMASRLNAVVLGITHLSKGGQGQDPASRVIGSIAFTAVARCVLVAAKTVDSEGVSKRILMRAKANNGPDKGGFEYHLEQSEPLPGIFASYATWGQAIEGTAREVFAEPDGNQDDDQNDAVSMLKAELVSDCWTPAKQVFRSMSDAGFSKDQVKRASKKLAVLKKKGGMDGGWFWRLPGNFCDDDIEDVQQKNAEGSTEGGEGSALNKRTPFAPFAAPFGETVELSGTTLLSESEDF